MDTGFIAGLRREVRRLGSRPIYMFGMIIVPVLMAVFFLSLMSQGLPERTPTAVVDLDHSSLSRSITRNLSAQQMIDVTTYCESYDEALAAVRRGEIFGFFVIPDNFEKDVLGGEKPTLEYYSNMTYFIPGTLSFKAFKTIAVATSGGVIRQTLQSAGISDERAAAVIQPVVITEFALSNPWMNYAYYLGPSFSMCTLVLMIMLVTVFSITKEIKDGTSPLWLATARGRISMAVTTKLLPHTVIWCAVGLFILWILFGYAHFPMNGSLGWLIAATFLTVVASQAFALFICSALPNPRLAFSVTALFCILSFSFTGFSFPVQSMYGYLGVFSWLAPIRYWFLIYVNEGLNGVALYYSRLYYAALLLFPLGPALLLWNLRRMCLKPVYVP